MAFTWLIDNNGVPATAGSPAEAVQINGDLLEDVVPNYRTIYVSGREGFSPEVEYNSVGSRDGELFKSKRFPARVLTVGYAITAPSNSDFRTAFNTLNNVLNVEEAEFIFSDEPDKFFIGTPQKFSEVDHSTNVVTGTFEIYCADPFKYSVTEYEVTPTLDDGKTFAITYNGTHQAYPIIEADFATVDSEETQTTTYYGDCGYVAFADDEEHILQFGSIDETEGADLAKSQTLVNQNFAVAIPAWTANIGPRFWTEDSYGGAMKKGTRGMEADTYGTAGAYWHGPSVTKALPADASSVTGATDGTLAWTQLMATGLEKSDQKKTGTMRIAMVNVNGSTRTIVAGALIHKGSVGNKGYILYYINGKSVGRNDIDLSYYNQYFGFSKPITKTTKKRGKVIKTQEWLVPTRACSITKSGSNFIFKIGGITRAFEDADAADLTIHEMMFFIGKYNNVATINQEIWNAKFTKDNCDIWTDVPNKFSANDILTSFGDEATVRVNNEPRPDLGAVGNDWEGLCLTPGTNQIHCMCSDWASPQPTFKMRYREVFL